MRLFGCFQAFSAFYGITKDLNLTSDASLDEIQAATMNVCRKSWNEVSAASLLFVFVCVFVVVVAVFSWVG